MADCSCGHSSERHTSSTGVCHDCTHCLCFKDPPKPDRLQRMWDQQTSFMRLLQTSRGFPEFPVDLASKQGQKFIKGLMHECMDELHESLQHLKNAKDHRATEVTGFDRGEFVEELADTLHYFVEISIASGVDLQELFDAFIKKGEINEERIRKGY